MKFTHRREIISGPMAGGWKRRRHHVSQELLLDSVGQPAFVRGNNPRSGDDRNDLGYGQ